jgi:splicing factor 3B subunit 2
MSSSSSESEADEVSSRRSEKEIARARALREKKKRRKESRKILQQTAHEPVQVSAAAAESQPIAFIDTVGNNESMNEVAIPEAFRSVFDKFNGAHDLIEDGDQVPEHEVEEEAYPKEGQWDTFIDDEEDDVHMEGATDNNYASNKQRKQARRAMIAEYKKRAARPEVVELHDLDSRDPELLIHLKSYRNTVAVPRHWSSKRRYLAGKRGSEKPTFQLPHYIEATGIRKIREAIQAAQEQKSMARKSRDRARPKSGRLDLDFQVLHDAFFKHQTAPPNMTRLGELYYEGKEHDHAARFRSCLPGGPYSEKLLRALGWTPGGETSQPPPWLWAMQQVGPPPSYPKLVIPGLNAPLPAGASYGFHAGQWGQPPVDSMGRPLYGGDPFGKPRSAEEGVQQGEQKRERQLWGKMVSSSADVEAGGDEDGEDEDEENGEHGEEDEEEVAGAQDAVMMYSDMVPDSIQLRK